MATNKPALRTVEEFMVSYVPKYNPLYSLFLGNAQKYNEEVGELNLRRISTVGDLAADLITPKDTVIKQIAVGESKKTFKKFFAGNQYVLSHLQAQEGTDQTISEVLDYHQKQFDNMFLTGLGTSNSTMVNNGLFWSGDANFDEISPATLASGATQMHLFFANLQTNVALADQVAGRKAIIFYGNGKINLHGLFSEEPIAFKGVLQDSLPGDYTIVDMPTAVEPASSHGYIIANLDQLKLHYTKLPMLDKNGSNEEKGYYWWNFLMGSCMLEVLSPYALIKQPLVFS